MCVVIGVGRRVKWSCGRLRNWCRRRRVLNGGVLTQPFGLHQILEKLRDRPTAHVADRVGPFANVGMDGEVEFLANLVEGFGFASSASHFIW